MTKPLYQSGLDELLERIRTLETQLISQSDLQLLVEELQVHQEEVRVQNQQLVEAQHALELSRDRYSELYDFAPIAFLALDLQGIVCDVNLAGGLLLGAERERIIGTPLVVHLEESSRRPFREQLARMRRGEPAGLLELDLGTATASRPVEFLMKRFRSAAGGPVQFHLAMLDLTERRHAEEERLTAATERARLNRESAEAQEASRAKDRFFAVLSHELRTPLTPALLMLEALQMDSGDARERQHHIDVIRRNLLMEARLVDDLLDLSMIDRGRLHLELDKLDLHAEIRHALEGFESETATSGLTLRIHLDAPEPFVQGDGVRIAQVFTNLLRNAVANTPRGGAVILSTTRDAQSGEIRAEVRDTGRGIAPADLERIFEPFQQGSGESERGRLGLGLAICRGIMNAHGGSIRAQSQGTGTGALFTLAFPPRPEQAEQIAPGPRPVGARRGLRILVVEDHIDAAEALGHLLRLHGFEVHVAHSLREARSVRDRSFDLLISDVQLPDGSGLDLMREVAGHIRGIALSGFGSELDVERSRNAGFETHLVKPVEIRRVLDAIDQIVPRS